MVGRLSSPGHFTMRIDHYAYQQATRVAVFGFLIQLAIGLTALLFGQLGHDTTFVYGSYWVLIGCLVWLSLIVIFHQHKLERLESLEADELAALRGMGTSVFDREGDELKVAARRLRLMHKWLMPAVSLVTAGLLLLMAVLIWRDFTSVGGDVTTEVAEFQVTTNPGWAVAICLSLAALSFIFSRFVAGMAKQQAWQNLRGGAGYMVGNSLVMFATAVGIIFIFFNKTWVMEGISKGIAGMMFLIALEILLNFMLNLYRPRRPGEMPRPAFDSKLLSLFAAPDSIVRSINEAVNYQFGFDITSSWGYQLLLRSFLWLAVFGGVVLIGMNMLVVVSPGEQALRLRGGRIVDDQPHGPGLMFKLPWPIETAHIEKVARVREMALGAKSIQRQEVNLWDDELRTDVELKPFIVGARLNSESEGGVDGGRVDLSLINAELIMYWRIREDGLVNFLTFADDTESRRQRLNMRERAIRAIALREASLYLKDQPFDEVLSQGTQSLGPALRERIQTALDAMNTGIEVVTVTVPMLKPHRDIIPAFSELAIEVEGRREKVIVAMQSADTNLTMQAVSRDIAEKIVAEIDVYRRMQQEKADPAQITEKMLEIEGMLLKANGQAAATLARASAERWKLNMGARTRSREVNSDLASFLAAPELYKQRKIMDVFSGAMSSVRAKYIFGIDPAKVNIEFTVQEPDTGLNISENIEEPASEGEETN